MELQQRPDQLARIDPTFNQPKAPSPIVRSVRPQELLGIPPGADVAYFSQRAQALLGGDAAFIDAPIPRYDIRGAAFDALA